MFNDFLCELENYVESELNPSSLAVLVCEEFDKAELKEFISAFKVEMNRKGLTIMGNHL